MKVYIVGHTDNVASLDLNTKLSQARAEAVVQALVTKHGIGADRLIGRGVGPLAPVASNGSEENRAQNRRVELVKQLGKRGLRPWVGPTQSKSGEADTGKSGSCRPFLAPEFTLTD